MVQVDSLLKSYGDRILFSDVSFHVGKGERCVLAGRNGSGKTTLLKIISGLEEYDEGEVRIPKGLRIGTLPQHLHFEKETVIEEVVFEEEWRAEIILEGLGFSLEEMQKDPRSFSGGYQLRIVLAKVLARDPDLLLLDEPTNYLDILAIRWLEEFLINWQGQLIFVSHDTSFVNKVCTHVIGLKRGKLQKLKGDLFHYRNHIAIQDEERSRRKEKLDKKKAHMESFVERFGAKASKAAQAQSRVKALEKMESLEALELEQGLNFRFNFKEVHNKQLFKLEGVNFSYKPDAPLIRNVSLEIEKGKHIAIIGKNGSGKSTLLKLIAGLLTPLQGTSESNVNTKLAYFGQTNIEQLNPLHTIEEELHASFPDAPMGQVRSVCGAMLFSGDDVKKRIDVLSGGERSRVLLAKILLQPANLILLDEPTHHLDVESVEALMNAIAEFKGSVVLVSHDEDALKKFKADQLIICHKEQQEIFLGDYTLFLQEKGWEEEVEKPKVKKKKVDDNALKKVRKKLEVLMRKIDENENKKIELETKLDGASEKLFSEYGSLTKRLEKQYLELEELLTLESKLA